MHSSFLNSPRILDSGSRQALIAAEGYLHLFHLPRMTESQRLHSPWITQNPRKMDGTSFRGGNRFELKMQEIVGDKTPSRTS